MEPTDRARQDGPLEQLVGRLNDYGRAHEGYSDDPYERQKAADMYDAADVIETTLKTQHLDIARDFAAGYKAACKIHAQAEIKRLRDALESVIAKDQLLGCTAASDGAQVWHDGPCAEIARAALTPNASLTGGEAVPLKR